VVSRRKEQRKDAKLRVFQIIKKTSDKLNNKPSIKLSSQKLKDFNILLSEKGTSINYESSVFSRLKNIFK